jgi:hypothetical protein
MPRLISHVVTAAMARRDTNRMYRDWDRALSQATSQSHRAEINAVFARHLNEGRSESAAQTQGTSIPVHVGPVAASPVGAGRSR